MANRKVLINRHSTKQQAPEAASMFLGEIAISHPSEVSATTIYTRNGNVMVPFISCAQTISIIDGKVKASEDSVVAKAGELHLEVESAGTPDATIWQISSKDIQSKEAFDAYSAATDTRIETVADALDSLLDISVTGITGDSIITATLVEPATGSNAYNLTHKQALATDGFNKLATDAYGHVTASTAVATADIEALGFKTSAATEDEIEAAIEALSAVSVSTGKYFTAIGVENGKLVKEEADLPTLEIESAGTGNVVSQIKVEGHKISYSATSVATSEDIQELSAATGSFSAATFNEFASAFTAINNLSADTEAADGKVFTSAKTYADELIAALDSSTAVTTGKYITGIAIADGKISGITEADVPVLASAVTGTGNVVTDIAVSDHTITFDKGLQVASDADLQALSGVVREFSAATDSRINDLSAYTEAVVNKVEALSAATISISGYAHDEIAALSAGTKQLSADTVAYVNQLSGYAHGEIVELSGAVQANETDIDNLSAATLALSAVTLTGVSLNNTPLTVTDHVVSVPVTVDGTDIANATDSGSVADAKAVKEYVEGIVSSAVEYKGSTDAAPSGTPSKGDLYIASGAFTIGGKNVEVGDFIIYDGTKWDVIEKNLDGAITGNLTQGTVVLGDSTNSVESLANGSNGQVLTMVNGAPAWANDPELTVVSAGTGNVLTDITVNDHEITFTKGVTAADDADLQALSGVVEDFSGATDAKFIELSAYTKDVDDKVKALSAGTLQLSADTVAYVDEQIDEVYASGVSYTDAKVATEIALLDSSTAVTTGKYITGIAIADGKISGITEESLPANVPITATTETPVDTASAVLTSVTTGGTDGHELTFGMSNKVFSAKTSESADTAAALTGNITSGQVSDIVAGIENTKVHEAESADTAASAEKVANALSISGYATSESSALDTTINYDGSQAKSLTFGTNTAAGKSMSMTSAGVVDVEIIDCGEY